MSIETDVTTISVILREYGAAFRGDWSGIDGRAVRDEMDTIADALQDVTRGGASRTPAQWRDRLGLCPNGAGHWTFHCDDDCGGGRR